VRRPEADAACRRRKSVIDPGDSAPQKPGSASVKLKPPKRQAATLRPTGENNRVEAWNAK